MAAREDSPFTLAAEGLPKAAIVIGKGAASAERHASEELAGYVARMSGAKLPIKEVDAGWEGAAAGPLIAIGLRVNNPVIGALVEAGLLKDPAELHGYDGYSIAAVHHRGRAILALVGSNVTSAVYPVYHLLEYEFGCGFFQDGEFIPRSPTLTVGPQRVEESSRFAEHYGVPPTTCGGWYSLGQLFGFDDWKQDCIDWMAKHRLNQTMVMTEGATDLVRGRALQRIRGEEPTYRVSNDISTILVRTYSS
jgi:hypothetical protein